MARRAEELKSLRWGMFACWSFSTFSGKEWTGGGTGEEADATVPEGETAHPECTMFGKSLPAYGFYCRHVTGLRFSNAGLRAAAADLRHAMVFDDVENLAIDGLDAAFWPGGAPMLSLVQTHDAIISGCQPSMKAGTLLKLNGDKSRNIALAANDLSGAAKSADVAPEVPKDALLIK